MLEIYFDDSGTHKGSRVAVWGGIVGYKEYLSEFEVAWRERLVRPCDGRPSIKAFHSSHLAASDGEFAGYSEAERDLTRYNFRKVIVDAGLTVLSFGVSLDDWDDIVTGPSRMLLGSGERLIFGLAVLKVCIVTKVEKQPLSFQFDRGRRTSELDSIIQPALDVAEVAGHSVSYGFSPVAESMGLQAADLVAHETYQFFTQYLDDKSAMPGPHLRRLIEDAHDFRAAWMDKEQIQSMFDGIEPLLKRFILETGRGSESRI